MFRLRIIYLAFTFWWLCRRRHCAYFFPLPLFIKMAIVVILWRPIEIEVWRADVEKFLPRCRSASPTTISFSPRLFAAAAVGRSVVGRLVESPRLRWFRRHSGKVSECQGPTEEPPSKITARWCRNSLSLEGLVWCSMKWAPQWTLLLFTTCALKQQALEISQSWNCLIQTWTFQKSRNVELSVFFWLMPPNRGLSKAHRY